MRRHARLIGLIFQAPVCLLTLVTALACQRAQTGSASSLPSSQDQERFSSAPSRDLSQDESAGGHTLRKHVGRTDDELRERLRRERNISAASTWTDRETAEHAVGFALAQNHDKIQRWVDREEGHPKFVVDYDGDPAHPIGRSLRRGDERPGPCAHATVVLKYAGPNHYYVLTSYPECRE
jgi:hypothetical protein